MSDRAEEVRRLARAGDWRAALKIAAAFPYLGRHKVAIERGWQAYARPEFCREVGLDPDRLVAEGIAALRERYLQEERAGA
jgi:hypothetical protein